MPTLIALLLGLTLLVCDEALSTTVIVGNTVVVTNGTLQTFQIIPPSGPITLSSSGSTFTSGGSIFNPFPAAGANAPLVATNTSGFNPFPLAGAAAPLTFTGGSVFNPFPLAGASAPLVGSNTSIFNPFPLSGAAAPLAFPGSGIVTDSTSGSGSAPFFPNSPTASASSVAAAAPPTATPPRIGSGTVLNPFPVAGAGAPLVVNNTSIFNPFPGSGATAPLTSSSVTTFSPSGAFTQSSSGVLIQNPEPASLILLATGLAGLAWRIHSRRSKASGL